MAKIITIHGTFASGLEEGSEWWQLGSQFQAHVSELLEPGVGTLEFEPLLWSGENSETARRIAAQELVKKLQRAKAEGEKVCIVAHSHGGSVASRAFSELHNDNGTLANVSKCISIGTPFIKFERIPRLFDRLKNIDKTIYILLFPFLITLMYFWYIRFTGITSHSPAYMFLMFGNTTIELVVFGSLLLYLRRKGSFELRSPPDATRKSWLCLWHSDDEAIGSLSRLPSSNFDVFSKTFAVAGLTYSFIFLLPLAMAIIPAWDSAYSLIVEPWNEVPPGDDDFIHRVTSVVMLPKIIAWRTVTQHLAPSGYVAWDNLGHRLILELIELVLMLAIYFFLSTILLATANKISVAISPRISDALNLSTTKQLRKHAFGDDVDGEQVIESLPTPFLDETSFPPLPSELAIEISQLSDLKAISVISNLRKAFGEVDLKSVNDLITYLEQNMNRGELIHTSYFENGSFRKLVALAICSNGCFKPAEALLNDPDYHKVQLWLKGLAEGGKFAQE